MNQVLFACVHNAGRSQMAAAFFNALAAPEHARAISAGTECPLLPGLERVDWNLPDPKGLPLPAVRAVRDDIRRRVAELVAERGWGRKPS